MRSEYACSAHRCRIILALLVSVLGSFSLCGRAQPRKLCFPGSTVYDTWDVVRNGRLLALPIDTDSGDNDTIMVLEQSRRGYRVQKVLSGGPFVSWSPAGKYLAFSRWSNGNADPLTRKCRIGLYSLKKNRYTLFSNGFCDRDPAWRVDGSKIAFARLDPGKVLSGEYARSSVVVVSLGNEVPNLSKSTSYEVVGMAAEALRWRPCSDVIAYVGVGRTQFEGNKRVRLSDLYLLDIVTGKTRQITHCGDVSRFSIDWSPDGRYIVYATGLGRLKSLEIVDVDTGERRSVVSFSNMRLRLQKVKNIRWSPDGKWVVFDASEYETGKSGDIGVVDLPSCRLMWLSKDGKSKAPRWSADGKILFVRNGTEIWRMLPNGGKQERLYRFR